MNTSGIFDSADRVNANCSPSLPWTVTARLADPQTRPPAVTKFVNAAGNSDARVPESHTDFGTPLIVQTRSTRTESSAPPSDDGISR